MLGDRWRSLRPPIGDVALAAGFTALGQAVTWGGLFEAPWGFVGPRLLNAVFNLALTGALAWRRRAPFAAVCWAVGAYFLPHLAIPLDVTLFGAGVPLVVLTASAGYHCARGPAIVALAAAVAGLLAMSSTIPEMRTASAYAFNIPVLLVPWLGARGLREREDRAALLAAALATERAAREHELAVAAAAERTRIARELHDIVAHSVSVMVIQVGAARMHLRTDVPAAESALLDAEEVGRQAVDDLRRLLGVLRADDDTGSRGHPAAPQPGLSQLDGLVAQSRSAGLRVRVDVAGDPVALPPGLDLTAYRIVQEALTNSRKHGRARRAHLRLRYSPADIRIDVTDDGAGTTRAEDGPGHGLIGMRERAHLFGGSVAAGPLDGGGWRVRARLPLPAGLRDDRAIRATSP